MNSFRQLLKAAGGHPPLGTWIMSASPIVAEAVGCAGFDWGVIDMEHAPLDMMEVVQMLQALSSTRMVPLVRLPWNDSVMVKRVLDGGATTLLFPFVQNADEATRAVASTRYAPEGHRGMSAMSRASRFATMPNYLTTANKLISVVVQLETDDAVGRLEEIAAVDGVDALFIGPADLSASMGHVGQLNHPAVVDRMAQAVRRAKECGKPIGTLGHHPGERRAVPRHRLRLRRDRIRPGAADARRAARAGRAAHAGRRARAHAVRRHADGRRRLLMARLDITPVPVPPSRLGESPFWHPREGVLYWCDIPGRTLNRYDPRSNVHEHWQFDSEPGCCAPLLEGGLVLAMRDGLWRFDPAGGRRERLAKPPYDEATQRFNDGKADPQGRLWVGTMYEPRDKAVAALYRYDAGELERMAGDITLSNGLAWSPDARTLYWADTTAHVVYALDFDAANGALSNRRVFASFARRDAEPAVVGLCAAAPTARRSMPKALTGWRCSKAPACCALRRTANCCKPSSCRSSARPCRASAGRT